MRKTNDEGWIFISTIDQDGSCHMQHIRVESDLGKLLYRLAYENENAHYDIRITKFGNNYKLERIQ